MKKFFNDIARMFKGDPDKIGDHGLTRLQRAIIDNDVQKVVSLIKAGANVNYSGNMVYPPMHFALDKDRMTIALTLLQAGADVNMQDTHGQTPLHKAAEHCHEAFIHALLKQDADANIRDKEGKTPLHVVSTARPEVVDTLVKYGANVNAQDNDGNTPMHLFLDKAPIVERLLVNGGDPNLRNNAGQSPYMVMLEEEKFEKYHKVMQQMLNYKADLGSTNLLGETVLHLAARLEMQDTFNRAFPDAELRVTDTRGNNVLHALVRTQNVFMISRVLDKAPELLHQENHNGATPLAELTRRADRQPYRMNDRFIATARVMIIKGANPSVTDDEGRTLLHHCIEQDRASFAEYLISKNININTVDKKGRSALHIAIDRKDMNQLDMLLDAGADPDVTDAKGWTILDRLAEKNDRDSPVVQRLIVAGGQYQKQLPLHPELMRPRNAGLDKEKFGLKKVAGGKPSGGFDFKP